MSISAKDFELAQSSEAENWVKDVGNDSRILYELVEHSSPAGTLRKLLGGRRVEKALEAGIGCFGLGFLAVHLWDIIDSIDGIDPLARLDLSLRDPSLQQYVNTVRARVNYIQAMAEAIPADDQSYDLVSCINVIDHAKAPAQIIEEINRVLKPGGLFAFGVSTLSFAGEKKWQFNRWRRPKHWHFLAHPHTYQWHAADALVRRIPGKVLWSTSVSAFNRLIGKGRMSFWIVQKA